jgi:outer membrane receptor protein involved in Fe transport
MLSHVSRDELRRLKCILFAATSVVAIGGARLAYAQTADQPAEAVESVTVTGTHLIGGFVTPTPVTVQDETTIDQRAPSTISDVLNQMPQMRQSVGNTQAPRGNGSGGQNQVDLRGLGVQRSLVLMDGTRIVPTNINGTIDVNLIPTSVVSRIEVVTGGASAAYGSDAVGGVVNFIMKDRMNEIEGTVQYGISDHGDNMEPLFSMSGGTDLLGGRLHLVGGGDWSYNHGVGTIYSRPDQYGDATPNGQWCSVTNPANHAASGLPAISLVPSCTWSTQAAGSVIVNSKTNAGANSAVLNTTAFGANGVPYTFNQGTVASTLMYGGAPNPQDPHGNPNGNWLIEAPHKRATALIDATYDIDDDTSISLVYEYGENSQKGLSTFHQETNIIVPVSGPFANPYVPASIQAIANANNLASIIMGKQEEALGGYQFRQTDRMNRFVLSGNGRLSFWGDWSWDAHWQHGETRESSNLLTNVLEGNYLESIFAVKDNSGNIVCGPVASNPNFAAGGIGSGRATQVQPGCVPFNIFGPTLSVVPVGNPPYAIANVPDALLSGNSLNTQNVAAANYFVHSTNVLTHIQQDTFDLNFHGEPLDMPAGPIRMAFGFEHRRTGGAVQTDAFGNQNFSLSNNGTTYSGSFEVNEGYMEFGIPLLKNNPAFNNVDADIAMRLTGYSTSGNRFTWKVGLNWQVSDSLRLRTTASRDVREPSLQDLFAVQSLGITASFANPVSGLTGPEYTLSGGNPNLKTEQATSYVAGMVITPSAPSLEGMNLSVDYFNTRINGVIGSVSAAQTATYCAQQIANGFYCQFMSNNGPGGALQIQTLLANLNAMVTDGVDFEYSYSVPSRYMDWIGIPGGFRVRWLTTWTDVLSTHTAITRLNVAGSGIGGGLANWISNMNLNYDVGISSTNLQFRYIGSLKADATLVGPGQNGYDPSLPNSISKNLFPDAFYVDIQQAFDLSALTPDVNSSFFFNVNNLLDRHPPGNGLALVAFVTGGDPYDLIGRTYKVGLRARY